MLGFAPTINARRLTHGHPGTIAVIVHTISHQGGRIDALNSTLLSMLHLVKASPGLREAIEAQLEQNYSSLLARSENPQYVAGFESVRDMITAALK